MPLKIPFYQGNLLRGIVNWSGAARSEDQNLPFDNIFKLGFKGSGGRAELLRTEITGRRRRASKLF